MEVDHMQTEEVVAWARLGNLLRSHNHRALSRPLCQIAHCRNRGLVYLYCGRLSLDRPSLHPLFCLAHTYRSDCRPLVNTLFFGLLVDLCSDPLDVQTAPAAVGVVGSLAVLSACASAVSVSQVREL